MEAVVEKSDFDENPRNAIKSLLVNQKRVTGLHLVEFGYDSSKPLYPGWNEDLASLRQANLDPVWHNELDLTLLKKETEAIVFIPPDAEVKDSAFHQLQDSMEAAPDLGTWAVTSEVDLRSNNTWYGVPAYGFLLVVYLMDAVRWAFSLTRYHRTFDLRAHAVVRTYKNRVTLVQPRWWFHVLYTRVAGTVRGGIGCKQVPDQLGWTYLWRTIRLHAHLSLFSLWWPLVFLAYYWLFALPWWNRYIPAHTWYLVTLLRRDPTHVISIATQGLHIVGVLVVANTTMKMPAYCNVLALLFPFYLTVFPIILVIGRFYMSNSAWNRV